MAKNSKATKRKRIPLPYVLLLLALAVALLARIIGWPAYQALTTKKVAIPVSNSRMAYVDGSDATEQVANFYRQYTRPSATPAFQKQLVSLAGTQNLGFYDEYYRHGFDPITCSVVMPSKVTASLISTGPIAIVKAVAEYPDGTSSTINVRVVLGERLNIDSITCPGSKGNLMPAS